MDTVGDDDKITKDKETRRQEEAVTTSSKTAQNTIQVQKEAEPVKKTVRKVAVFNQFKRKGTLSIAEAQKVTEQKDEQVITHEDLSGKPRTPFTQEDLNAKWKAYTYLLQKEKRIGLYATLSKRQPELKDNFEVLFTIDSQAQMIDLENERPNLLAFLRKELNNYGISLKINVAEAKSKSTKYLSSKDRFLQMAEKNEALHHLKSKLGLDLEY